MNVINKYRSYRVLIVNIYIKFKHLRHMEIIYRDKLRNYSLVNRHIVVE